MKYLLLIMLMVLSFSLVSCEKGRNPNDIVTPDLYQMGNGPGCTGANGSNCNNCH